MSVLEMRILFWRGKEGHSGGENSVAISWEEVQRLLSRGMVSIKAEDAGGMDRNGLE